MTDLPKDPFVISGEVLEGFRACVAVLKGYEQWEADIILENKCWTGQNIQLTDELYERMIELQTMRNRAFAAVGGSPDR